MAKLIISTPETTETINIKNLSVGSGIYAYFYNNKAYVLTRQNFSAGVQRYCFICLQDPLSAPTYYPMRFCEAIEQANKDGHSVYVYDSLGELAEQILKR